jgi:hypothetical protein
MKLILVGMPVLSLIIAFSASAVYHMTAVYPMELPTPNHSAYLSQCKLRDQEHALSLPS